MTLLERVAKNKPHFADYLMEELTQKMIDDARRFSFIEYWNGNDSVNVHEVCGTMHPDYCGHSWLNLLHTGKRMGINLGLLEENPSYYDETSYKPEMSYISINDKIYISTDGNHRTCIAKFHFYLEGKTKLHGVNMTSYRTDEVFKKTYEDLEEVFRVQKIPAKFGVTKKLVKREDSAGWKKDYFNLFLTISNFSSGFVAAELDIQDMLEILRSSSNPFRAWIGKYSKLWRR